MSLRTRRPMRMLGGAHVSGNLNTGEMPVADGGQKTVVVWSGGLLMSGLIPGYGTLSSGNQIMLWSGAGRLNTLQPHVMMQSGLAVFFYDTAAIAGSGVGVSGQRIIALIPPTHKASYTSGAELQTFPNWRDILRPQVPFTSGLCVSAPSGAPGFTVSFTTVFDPDEPQGP